ncbi:hypothetical protein [Crocosphaera sp. Alani8]|uniref:hypothetical protein n=1 Tax=Crocosphaera sp. Alani8 TaxID=3038952 RepID=UPI00313A8E0E
MNNIQLKVKLISVSTEYIGQEAKIVVSGQAKFQFYEKGKTQTRTIPYRSFGQSALFLQEAGANSVHVVSGSLNVYPPNEHNPSHSMLLTVNNALPVVTTAQPSPVRQPSPTVQPQPTAPQPQPTANSQPIAQPSPAPQPQPTVQRQPTNESNGDDPIPF